jgi:hypothetical protein
MAATEQPIPGERPEAELVRTVRAMKADIGKLSKKDRKQIPNVAKLHEGLDKILAHPENGEALVTEFCPVLVQFAKFAMKRAKEEKQKAVEQTELFMAAISQFATDYGKMTREGKLGEGKLGQQIQKQPEDPESDDMPELEEPDDGSENLCGSQKN